MLWGCFWWFSSLNSKKLVPFSPAESDLPFSICRKSSIVSNFPQFFSPPSLQQASPWHTRKSYSLSVFHASSTPIIIAIWVRNPREQPTTRKWSDFVCLGTPCVLWVRLWVCPPWGKAQSMASNLRAMTINILQRVEIGFPSLSTIYLQSLAVLCCLSVSRLQLFGLSRSSGQSSLAKPSIVSHETKPATPR